ncbi:MAG: serine/threonine-protein kinase, partial [Pseudomonadota bacterium]
MNDDSATQRSVPDDQPTVRGLAAGQKVFGRFVLEVLLGRGGMGVVWRANDETLGETVALKFLSEVVARDAVAVDELKAETRRTRRLAHPHIVRVHDFMQDAQHAAVSMELVDGSTLAQLRLTQPGRVFAPETLAPMVAQLCEALDYAHHTAKVVHRDLKPANILVTRDGVAKISDFGIARNLSETHTRLTGTVGQTSGTLLYMSPQQLLGKKTTPADDIYALGATLYELITGKPPFYTGDITHQVLNVTPEGLAAQRIELGLKAGPIPRAWEETIQACLAKDPAQRPSSAGEVALRLGLMGGPARTSGMKSDASAAGQTEKDGSAADQTKVSAGGLLSPQESAHHTLYRRDLTKVAASRPPSPPADRGARRFPSGGEATALPRKFPWPLVAGCLLALLVIGGVALYFKVYGPDQSRQAAIKLLVEEEDRNAIAARIDRLEPGAPTAQRDATEAAVHAYLA